MDRSAAWEYAREGTTLRIKITGFGSLPPGSLSGIEEEARGIGRFLGAESVEVQVD
jgi:hypothetical protein